MAWINLENEFLKGLKEKYNPDILIAYGSGILSQDKDSRMIDLIFGVESTKKWHKENLKNNSKDYPFLFRTHPVLISILQELKPRIYYNQAKFEGKLIKYGVSSIENIIVDLENWTELYVAGRLQKPVKIFSGEEKIKKSFTKNLEYAVAVASKLLSSSFTEEALYQKIVELSYIGDIRMKIGEDPNKIKNIVNGNLEEFRNLYSGIIKKNPQELPSNLLKKLSSQKINSKNIRNAINQIIHFESIIQPIKGIICLGPINCILYAKHKLKRKNHLSPNFFKAR